MSELEAFEAFVRQHTGTLFSPPAPIDSEFYFRFWQAVRAAVPAGEPVTHITDKSLNSAGRVLSVTIESTAALEALPVGTKLYAAPVQQPEEPFDREAFIKRANELASDMAEASMRSLVAYYVDCSDRFRAHLETLPKC